MVNKARAGKNKGKKWQNDIRDDLLDLFPHLTKDVDIVSTDMGQSGEDIVLSTLAKSYIPYSIEAKCHSQGFTPVLLALKQAERNKAKDVTPIAVIKQDYQEPFVAIRYSDWLKMLGTTDVVEADHATMLRLLANQIEKGNV